MKKFFRVVLSLFMTLGTAMSSVSIAYATDTAENTAPSSTTSIAYAVFNPDAEELDFIRSDETHDNGTTGTIKSISGGTYTGTIFTGFEENTKNSSDTVPWVSIQLKIKTVKFIDTIKPTDTSSWFFDFKNCTSMDLKKLDTSDVTKMNSMFSYCNSLTSLDLSNFNTSNVTNFDYMFMFCDNLQSLDISNFDTSKAQGMASMFDECKSLTSLDLSNFDTSNVTSMRLMFGYAETLKSLDISSFDTSNTTDMAGMFISCPKLSLLKLGSKFKISSKNHKKMTSTPEETISGRNSSGKWGLDSETSNTTYSSDELVEKGKTAGSLAGNWYAQFGGSAAYAVFNPDTGEFDFVRSEENHKNKSTGTVKSISGGSYTGKIYTGFEHRQYSYTITGPDCIPWDDIAKKVKTVKTIDTIKPSMVYCWFHDMSNCTSMDLHKLDTSDLTNIGSMFYDCSSLKSVDISSFDTSKVTNLSGMFSGCTSLTSIDVSNFDTSNVTNMAGMFYDCSSLTSLDLSNFNTSKVTNTRNMFHGCTSLKSLDISNFDTSNVMDMYYMFSSCSKLSSLDLSRFDTSKTTDMNNMLENCTNLNKISFGKNFKCLSNINFPTPDASTASGKKVIGQWGLNSETADKTYTADELTTYGTEKIGNLAGTWFAQADVSTAYAVFNSDTGELDFIRSNETHKNNTTGTIKAISGKSYTGTIFADFENNTKSQKAPWSAYADKVKTVKFLNSIAPKNMANWFKGMSNCTEIELWDLDSSKTTDTSFLFAGCKALQSIELYNLDTSKVTNMDHMFQDCQSLTNIYTNVFDTSNVMNMNAMFSNCKSLESLDVSKFDTSKVKDMRYMFNNCSKLSSLDVSNFNTSNASIMTAMFNNCSNLKLLDVSHFDTSNVKYMNSMFYNDQKLSSIDLSSFDTSKVKEMNYMLYHSGVSKISFGEKFKVADAHTNTFSVPFKTVSKKASSGKWGMTSEKADTVYSASDLASQASLNGTWYAQVDNSTAYAVLNPSSGELDFIRSNETHENNTTGTIKSTSGKSYTGTIFTGFEENKKSQKAPWAAYANNIKYVNFVDIISPLNTAYWFNGMSSCTKMRIDNLNTSDVTDMSFMFAGCLSLENLDVSDLDTAKVTSMDHMFQNCQKLASLDLNNFDTSKVTNMNAMFSNCKSVKSLNVKSFNTSKVRDMRYMFNNCAKLESLDATNFDTSNVSIMNYMFCNCYNLEQLELYCFDTSNVKYMNYMFCNDRSLPYINLYSFDTSNVKEMNSMFLNTGLQGMRFSNGFKIAPIHNNIFSTPTKTKSGKASSGKWGLNSESAETSYSAEELANQTSLEGLWYAQAK